MELQGHKSEGTEFDKGTRGGWEVSEGKHHLLRNFNSGNTNPTGRSFPLL